MMDLGAVTDSILDRCKTVLAPNDRVYDTEVPPDVDTPRSPYVVVYFTTPTRSARDHGIASTRNDLLRMGALVQVNADDANTAKVVHSRLVDGLMGFIPTNGSEMVLEGGGGYSRVSTSLQPQTYVREAAFTFFTNLQWNT